MKYSDEFVLNLKNVVKNSELFNSLINELDAIVFIHTTLFSQYEVKKSEIKYVEDRIQALKSDVAAAREAYLSCSDKDKTNKLNLYNVWMSLSGEKDECKKKMDELLKAAAEFEQTLANFEEKAKSLYSKVFPSGEALFGSMENLKKTPTDEGKKPQSPNENGLGTMGK